MTISGDIDHGLEQVRVLWRCGVWYAMSEESKQGACARFHGSVRLLRFEPLRLWLHLEPGQPPQESSSRGPLWLVRLPGPREGPMRLQPDRPTHGIGLDSSVARDREHAALAIPARSHSQESSNSSRGIA